MTPRKLYIIGAPKSGTTSLANLLAKHPYIFLPTNKEPRYYTSFGNIKWSGPGSELFLKTLVTDHLEYNTLYANSGDKIWGIDASTDYLWRKESPLLIRKSFNETPGKIIVIFRNPAERAISEYSHTIRDEIENKGFIESLELEDKRIEDKWPPLFYHKTRSLYFDEISRYYNIFDKNEILSLEFGEFQNQELLFKKIFNFLEVPRVKNITGLVYNMSYRRRSKLIDKTLNTNNIVKTVSRYIVPHNLRHFTYKTLSRINKKRIKLNRNEIKHSYQIFENEIAKCNRELPIDTSGWKTH